MASAAKHELWLYLDIKTTYIYTQRLIKETCSSGFYVFFCFFYEVPFCVKR